MIAYTTEEGGEFVASSLIFNDSPNPRTITFNGFEPSSTDHLNLSEGYVAGSMLDPQGCNQSGHIDATLSTFQLPNHYSQNTFPHEFAADVLWHEFDGDDRLTGAL